MDQRRRRTQTFYVVFKGRNPGVYNTWETCAENVIGFRGCLYRYFNSREEAFAAYDSYCGRVAIDRLVTVSCCGCWFWSFALGIVIGLSLGIILGNIFSN